MLMPLHSINVKAWIFKYKFFQGLGNRQVLCEVYPKTPSFLCEWTYTETWKMSLCLILGSKGIEHIHISSCILVFDFLCISIPGCYA